MRTSYWHGCWRMRPAYGCVNTTTSEWRHQTRYHHHKSQAFSESRGHRSHGGHFGVRRPLRYLRYHLDLDESQTRRIAAILNQLKLEREQAQVDEKRSLHAVADLLLRDDVNADQFKTGLQPRVQSAERLQSEFARALEEIRNVLDPDQLEQFADMIRTGMLSL